MKYIISFIATVVLVGLDQWTKILTVIHLKNASDISLLEGIFELTYVENRGAAFGMLQNKIWLFAIFTVVVLGFMVMIFTKIPKEKRFNPLKAVMVLLFSGAIGNFIDRIVNGYVVDMFHFYWFEFPVFNVADIYVVISCSILVILMLFVYKDEELDFISFGRSKHE